MTTRNSAVVTKKLLVFCTLGTGIYQKDPQHSKTNTLIIESVNKRKKHQTSLLQKIQINHITEEVIYRKQLRKNKKYITEALIKALERKKKLKTPNQQTLYVTEVIQQTKREAYRSNKMQRNK